MRDKRNQFTEKITRREFIGTSALSLASLSTLTSVNTLFTPDENGGINNLFNTKVGIKFVSGGMIHETAHEGPCRTGQLKNMTYEAEMDRHKKRFNQFIKDLKERQFPPEAEILKPVDFKVIVEEKDVEFKFPEEEFSKVEEDIDKVDLFVVLGPFVSDIAVRIAKRWNKPITTVGNSWVVDVPAALRHYGLEGYVVFDWDDLNRLIKLLWVRKAFAQTKLLIVTDRFMKPSLGLASAIYNFGHLNKLYGMQYQQISNQEVANEIDRIIKSKNEQKRVEEIAKILIENAQAVHMTKENILNSFNYYLAIKNLMSKYGCNAFTIECREICPLEITAKYKFTPCMTFSLLKDSGYPCACQTDINALIAIMALSYISKKSVYMGNPVFDVKNNIVRITHDVPGLKMKGFDSSPLPYELRNFTVGGWGVTIRYDFNRDKGEVVTLARFNPGQTKVLITKGEILDGFGVDRISCSLGLSIKVPNTLEVFRKMADFGGHLVMAYGDYTKEIQNLAEIMPFEVVPVL